MFATACRIDWHTVAGRLPESLPRSMLRRIRHTVAADCRQAGTVAARSPRLAGILAALDGGAAFDVRHGRTVEPLTGAAHGRTVAADIGRNGCAARTVAALPDACRNWRTDDRRRTVAAFDRSPRCSPDCRTLAADCVANGARTACKAHGAFQTGADMGGAADGLQGRFRRGCGQTSRDWRERLPR